MKNYSYNGIELPALPQLNSVHQPRVPPRIPYIMLMPDGSVKDANQELRGYIPETESK